MKSSDGGIPKDANEALLRGDDMTRLILDAEPFKHNEIITFSDLREDVRSVRARSARMSLFLFN